MRPFSLSAVDATDPDAGPAIYMSALVHGGIRSLVAALADLPGAYEDAASAGADTEARHTIVSALRITDALCERLFAVDAHLADLQRKRGAP